MDDKLLLLTVILLVITSTNGQTYPGVVYRHPESQIALPDSGSETFVCTAQGDVLWHINDTWLSNNYENKLRGKGFTFSEINLQGYNYTTKNLTMTVPAINTLNGTKIQCETVGNDAVPVMSDIAWLWIVAPPLPPNVVVELTSWNTIQLSWIAPYTTEGYPIMKYIIYITNTTTNETQRVDKYPSDGIETYIIQDSPSDCHILQFEIVAENSAGISTAGVASAGFPVAVSKIAVNVSVVYLAMGEDLKPKSIVTFNLPEICSDHSGVNATYILEVRNSTGALVSRIITEYQNSIPIEETLTLEICTSYTVNVTVFVPSYSELGSHTDISVIGTSATCPNDDGMNSSTATSSSENISYMPYMLSAVCVLLVLTLIIGVGLTVLCLRQRRRKTMRSSITNHGFNRPLPPMANNPIYDVNDTSPVYDVIPEPPSKAKPQQVEPKFKRQLSCDIRYTQTPSSLTLHKEARQQRAMSMCHTPYSPQTPSPKEIDAMLCNTFGGTPSPLSQQCNGNGDGKRWYDDESSVYDTLGKKQTPKEEKEIESKKDIAEKEDCYVLMQSNVV